MPLYEYKCKKCGHQFEKIQKFSDKMVKKCPDCGGPVEQMISAPAVRFKGSGFYETDYVKKPSGSSSGDSGSGSKDKKDDKPKSDGAAKDSSSSSSSKENSASSTTDSSAKVSSSKESSSSSSKKSGKHK